MDVTRERISRIFQTGFNLVNAAVVCAILEGISGLEPPSDITAQLLQAFDCPKLLSVYFNLSVDATGVVIILVYLALISML